MRLDEDKGLGAASRQHVAVMADEVVALVRASRPMVVVDATVGTGGHAQRLLEETDAHLLGIDRDADALTVAASRLARFGSRVTLRQADFRELGAVLEQSGTPCVGAIVADLGMSSFALDDPARGFSFRTTGPLDMRMDQRQRLRASDLLNEESEAELARIIHDYGEERAARRIARAIVEARRRRPLETTDDLRGIVERVLGGRHGAINPATRTFQAIRIAVNHEMESLSCLLDDAPGRLAVGGRMVVLAYHSLEDRPVKETFRALVRGGGFAAVTRKAMRPSAEEASVNRRARSARLRCVERVAQ
ncbi:MAG TPA: 16S rRNA (cytosine(1402)-N(4))-methyltransferase RsmH [Candidatus Binataceae bacterium]|nr:16S rRNA (cytosine(1402)-N(4))-methyltransferase RsmH [Candidatus Binataceae bacterium]